MGLSKKNFWYSIFISLLLVVMITGYFVFMLPSLYEAHMLDVNYQSVIKLHQTYMEKGSYEGIEVRNPTGCISVEIPKSGNHMVLKGMNYEVNIIVLDEQLVEIMNAIGDVSNLTQEEAGTIFKELEESDLLNKIMNQEDADNAVPIQINFSLDDQNQFAYMDTGVKVHQVNDRLCVWESYASDEFNQYITYFAMEEGENGLIVTTLPVMAPKIDEIRPVVLESLPMITVVVFLLVLLFSQMYSRKIVNPIIKISHYVQNAMQIPDFGMDKLIVESRDEIGTLAGSINEMYAKLAESYMELKQKNKALEDENKRQEVFLRASSHQLKTPVAAALLLTEGILGEVGKYKDAKEYLPQIKEQLLSMKKIVDDILYLNGHIGELHYEKVDVMLLVTDLLSRYEIQIQSRQLELFIESGETVVLTDSEMLSKILDNLISNAVNYTEPGCKILITGRNNRLSLINYGGHIDEQLLQHIYEPFVSGNAGQKGHGLGLYVAAYYIGLLGYKLNIVNEIDGVRAEIDFGGEADVNN